MEIYCSHFIVSFFDGAQSTWAKKKLRHYFSWTASGQDGSHTGEVVRGWGSVEQACEHESDEYIKPVLYYSVSVSLLMRTKETRDTTQWPIKELTIKRVVKRMNTDFPRRIAQ